MAFSRRTILIASLCALGLTAIFETDAFGDEMADVRAIVTQPGVQQAILGGAKKAAVVVNNPCPSARFSLLGRVIIYKPVTFGPTGLATSGAWHMVASQEGCGVTRLLNVVVAVSAPGQLATVPLLPGTTIADPVLQKDAVQHAVLAAGGPEENCNIGYVENTEFLRYEGAPLEGAKDRPWIEAWTLVSCTKKAIVQIHFAPDRWGTSISWGLNETKIIELKTEKAGQ